MNYEVTKTIRFGLSPKNVGKKSGEGLSVLVRSSFNALRKQVETSEQRKGGISDVATAVKEIRAYVDGIKGQRKEWEAVYERDDMISVTKEYYKRLERDARFTGFEDVKFPQVSEIALSLVRSKSEQCPSKCITRYWGELLEKTRRLTDEFEPLLNRYESALEYSDQAHAKPNLVDFRKQFLSLLNVSSKWLVPLVEQGILFPKVATASEDGDRNRRIKKFVTEEEWEKRMNMKHVGETIRAYFEANGSIVPFGKATLNYHTALQKPHRFDDDIKTALDTLGIKDMIARIEAKGLSSDKLKSYFCYQTYCKGDKLEFFKNPGNISCIEKIQLFKPKPIPVSVRSLLAEKLSKEDPEKAKKIRALFDAIGNPIDIAKEYEQSDDKANFDLNRYPLKIAFDYAWESCSSFLKRRITDVQFPKARCVEFLKKFDVDGDILEFYANLRFIADELATVEHSKLDFEEEFICHIEETFDVISERLRKEQTASGQFERRSVPYLRYRDAILSWIRKPKEERNPEDAYFIKAKNKIGLLRGGLKNREKEYHGVTEKFKVLAMNFGKDFADLRDKLREADNLSKISHYSVIVEDLKKDRYVLLLPVGTSSDSENEGNADSPDADNAEVLDVLKNKLHAGKTDGDCVAYEVSSFTSKALIKMLKNPKGYASLFQGERGNININSRLVREEWKRYRDDSSFLCSLKECLVSSTMARDQRWQENFGWDFSACNTYADIEKEVDIKGYKLLKKYISESDIGLLVKGSDCLLFPVSSQDFSGAEDKFSGNKNRFTLEWEDGIDEKNGYRIHPEYKVFYQKPTEGYSERHRFGRFQAFAYFGVEVKNDDENFKTKSEKIKIVRDKYVYLKEVQEFNSRVNADIRENDKSYFYGMDRGINELATLCVLGKDKKIQDFIVFRKEKVDRLSRSESHVDSAAGEFYQYVFFEKRSILDLTNLKVETWHMKDEKHPSSEFLQEALGKIEGDVEMEKIARMLGYLDNKNERVTILVEYPNDRGSVLKLRMNHFQRALQFATSHTPELLEPLAETILKSAGEHDLSDEEKKKIIQGLFGLKKDFSNDADSVNIVESLNTGKINLEKIYQGNPKLFLEIFEPLARQFAEWYWNKDVPGYEKEYKARYEELEDLDTLKKGVAANIVGVIAFLMEKFPGIIVLEDVGKKEPTKLVSSRLDNHERSVDSHQEAEHYKWAGTEMYRYIEKKLVQKFGNWRQKNGETIHKTPPFANLESLNGQLFIKNGREVLNVSQFGIFCYVPPKYTSQICPSCGFCICKEEEKDNLPTFAKPFFKRSIRSGSLLWKKNVKNGYLEVIGAQGRTFTVKHFWAVQKKENLTESNVQDLLVTRLKSKKKLYERALIEKDPVFCSACGFNTEDRGKLLPINSGDEAAAYNIAKIGMEAFTK